MLIHIVQPGETIVSIAEQYGVNTERLILENGLPYPYNLAIGQTIVITYPEVVYTIQEGDTLLSIAESFNVSIMDILRNNPYLSDREYIYPGETIVITYETDKIRMMATSGYAYPFINRDVLRKTLPFLTYLTVFNYQVTAEGDFIDIDDKEIIQMAKDYGVAPMMFASTLSALEIGSIEVAYKLVNDPEVQERATNNVLRILKEKGYYGINIYIQYLNLENKSKLENYITKLAERLHAEGYRIILSFTPRTILEPDRIRFEEIDYSVLADAVDGILFFEYGGGYNLGAPGSVAPINLLESLMDFAVSMVPADKIFLGIPTTGYDWELPYVPGVTKANAVTTNAAQQIAADHGVPILFHPIAQAPYFYYISENQMEHIVWFKDARSFSALSALVPEYGLQGLSIWNIMNFNNQLWLIINVNYEIEKVPFPIE
jgi:spore germination protein